MYVLCLIWNNHVHTYSYIGTHISHLSCLCLELGNGKLNEDHVDLKTILTRIILEDTRYEWLSEIKAWDPVHIRFTILNPILKKGQSAGRSGGKFLFFNY